MNELQTSQTRQEALPPAFRSEDVTKIILTALGSCTVIAATYLLVSNDYNINADINTATGEAHFALSKAH